MPKILAQYPKIESIGSTGSIILGILKLQIHGPFGFCGTFQFQACAVELSMELKVEVSRTGHPKPYLHPKNISGPFKGNPKVRLRAFGVSCCYGHI